MNLKQALALAESLKPEADKRAALAKGDELHGIAKIRADQAVLQKRLDDLGMKIDFLKRGYAILDPYEQSQYWRSEPKPWRKH